MSKIKRIVALSLALVLLVAAMSVSAYAATPRTYKAWQIFTASTNSEGSMGNIQWNDSSINKNGFVSALKNAGLLKMNVSADKPGDVANALTQYADDSDSARTIGKLAYENRIGDGISVTPGSTKLATGYWIVSDETNLSGTDEVNNLAILRISKPNTAVEIEVKVDQPTMEKKVMDTNDSVANSQSDWQDSADYDIDDYVPFRLDAQLQTITDYDTYKVIFHDELSDGLQYDVGSAKYYVVHNGVETEINANATNTTVDGQNITFAVPNVLDCGATNGDIIRVEFNAKLTGAAVKIGPEGNPNECYLEYSNNPNKSGEGDNHSTGNTPKDKVTVFTYAFIVNKVQVVKDDNGNEVKIPLSGASFKLEKKVNNKWNEVPNMVISGTEYEGETVDNCVFTWSGLDDGIYKLTETAAPAGFNGAAPIEFEVTATHEIVSDDPRLQTLTTNNNNIAVLESNGQLTGEMQTAVVNEQGVVLPETGGTGNTVMYVMGSLMLLGAGVLLVSKRRMSGK